MRLLWVEYKEIFGGGQMVLLNLVREWRKQHAAIEPLVVCSPRAVLAQHGHTIGLRCETIELGAIEKTRGIPWNLAQRVVPTARLLEIMRAFQPNVVCANGVYSLLASLFAASLARLPVVWFEHNNKPLPDEHMVRWLLTRVRYAVVVSEMLEAQVLRLAPDMPKKIILIHNGVDVEQFHASENADAVRAEFGWTQNARVIGTVARLAPEKNLHLVLDAAQRILAVVPDAKFLIVGDGPLRAELQRRVAADHSLRCACVFTGERSDVARLLSALDIFVLPSDAEAFPLAILEAMATGLAVVATDVGDIREAVVSNETGTLVPPRDATALTNAVLDLLRNEDKRRAFGKCGRTRAAQCFSLERSAQNMLRVLMAAKK